MEKVFENIINEGKKNGKNYDEINAELKAAGATFHLDASGAVAGWTEEEMKEGFAPGAPAEKLPEGVDLRRRTELAGQTTLQKTKNGTFEVYYDEDGYAVKAKKV